VQSQASWEAEYQQNPIIVGGGAFPIEKIGHAPYVDRAGVLKSVRYFDKAGTHGDGAHTAGVLMHRMKDNTFEYVARGQWGALEREEKIKYWAGQDAQKCKGGYEVVVEQEPVSGGKGSAEATIRNLAGFRVSADKVTGSKEVHAEPFCGAGSRR